MKVKKAFGTVSHKILLQKLYHYGIRRFAHKLLKIYFASRSQFVTVQNYNSFLKSINICVPHGSILGPFLCLLCINDMPNATSCNPRLFAGTSKYLGVKLDFKLNCKPHIPLIENEVSRSVGILTTLSFSFLYTFHAMLFVHSGLEISICNRK